MLNTCRLPARPVLLLLLVSSLTCFTSGCAQIWLAEVQKQDEVKHKTEAKQIASEIQPLFDSKELVPYSGMGPYSLIVDKGSMKLKSKGDAITVYCWPATRYGNAIPRSEKTISVASYLEPQHREATRIDMFMYNQSGNGVQTLTSLHDREYIVVVFHLLPRLMAETRVKPTATGTRLVLSDLTFSKY